MAYIASSANSFSDNPGATTISVAIGAAVAVGDVIVGQVSHEGTANNVNSVTDSLGNTYSLGTKLNDTTNAQSFRSFYGLITVAGTPTVTTNLSGSLIQRQITLLGFSKQDALIGEDGVFATVPAGTEVITNRSFLTTRRRCDMVQILANFNGGATWSMQKDYVRRRNIDAEVQQMSATQTIVRAGSQARPAWFLNSQTTLVAAHFLVFQSSDDGAVDPYHYGVDYIYPGRRQAGGNLYPLPTRPPIGPPGGPRRGAL